MGGESICAIFEKQQGYNTLSLNFKVPSTPFNTLQLQYSGVSKHDQLQDPTMRLVNIITYPLTLLNWHKIEAPPTSLLGSTSDYGLKLIAPGSEPSIDIVMVHGLDGHWKKTWTAENDVFWPRDLLPLVLPDARVFSYGYDSRTRAMSPLAEMFIYDHAKALVVDLVSERRKSNTSDRPLIFIAHSLGGLIVKSALIHSDSARVGRLEDHKSIQMSTLGLLFLGTPHQGGQGANLGKIVAHIGSLVTYTSSNVIRHLVQHSEWLQQQQSQYAMIADDFQTVCFYETLPISIPIYGSILVVPKYSAVIQNLINVEEVPMTANHRNMAKYTSLKDENFNKVSSKIVEIAMTRRKITDNWYKWRNLQLAESGGHSPITTTTFNKQLSEFLIQNNIPHTRNKKFVGREKQLSYLDSVLNHDSDQSATKIVILYGTGGVGKTQLTIEFAYEHSARYSSIFWIDGSSLETTERSIVQAAHLIKQHYIAMGLVESYHYRALNSTTKPEDVRRAFHGWLSDPQNTDWLVLFDNVDDLDSFNIKMFIPHTEWGRVIITSRRSESTAFGKGLHIDDMAMDDALELFKQSSQLNDEDFKKEQEFAEEIVNTLGYLPLAISQAGAFISTHKEGNPIKRYLLMYQRDARKMLAHKPPTAIWDYRNDTVLTTWEISFSAIQDEMPLASHILLLCGLLDRTSIQGMLFVHGLRVDDDIMVAEAIQKLVTYSFIRRDKDSDHFSMHPLVHRWARERLESKKRQEMAKEAIILIYRAYYASTDKIDKWRLWPHLLSVQKSAETYLSVSPNSQSLGAAYPSAEVYLSLFSSGRYWDEDSPTVLNSQETPSPLSLKWPTCYFLWAYGHINDLLLSLWKYWTGDTEWAQTPSQLLYQLGFIFRDRYDFDREEHLYRWVLSETWHEFPRYHPRALAIAGDIGTVLYRKNEHHLARLWSERTFQACKCVLGKTHPVTMGALLGLGDIMWAQGHDGEALKLWQDAYSQRKRILGVDDILMRTAKWWRMSAFLGPDDPSCGNWYSQLYDPELFSTSVEFKAKLAILGLDRGCTEQAMQLGEQLHGRSTDWNCRVAQIRISNLDQAQSTQDIMAVIEEYQDYLDQHPGCEQTSGHISAALRLGNLYLDIDQVDSAVDSIVATVNFPFIWDNLTEDMIDVVVELLRRAMNIDHTSSKILQALDQLLEEKSLTSQFSWFKGDLIELKGVWFQENGHLEEALGHYNLLHSHVMEHPDRDEAMEAWSLSRISLVLFHQHRYKEALKNFKRVLELDEASTKDSEEIFENYINIAITYWKLEDYWGSFEWSQNAITQSVDVPSKNPAIQTLQDFIAMFLEMDWHYEAWALHVLLNQGDSKWGSLCPQPYLSLFSKSLQELRGLQCEDVDLEPTLLPSYTYSW